MPKLLQKREKRENKPEQSEMDIKGPGVERVSIPEVEKAARIYVTCRDERMELLEEEIEFKKKLREVMHANEDKIGKDRDGSMIYRFGDQLIVLKPGKEDVKVKTAPGGPQASSEEEEDIEKESSNGSE